MNRLHVMGKRFKSRMVLQVIEALLPIAITVTAALLVYVFPITVSGNLASSGAGQQTEEEIMMEAYNFPVNAPLTISFRNIGTAAVDMSHADYFLNGVAGSPGGGCKLVLAVSKSCTTTLSVPTSNLISSSVYTLKLFSSDGGVFVYPVVYGGSG